MPTTYFPFRWMVGTFQEILDFSSGNWVRIRSITDLRVLSFVGSCATKYSSTELNLGRVRDRGWRVVLRGDMAGSAAKLVGPLAAPSSRLRLDLTLEIERHSGADKILQRRLIDPVAFVDVDGPPDIPLEAGIE